MLYLILKTVEAKSIAQALKLEAEGIVVKVEEAAEQVPAEVQVGFNR